jgi:hypothetical protein
VNINQAKALARIRASVLGRKSLEAAAAHCKAGIVAARKAGDDGRAAELSEARQVFKKRLQGNNCQQCGKPIADGASNCRFHQRVKALPGPCQTPAKGQRGKWRVDASPDGGAIARWGYYSPSVRKVIQRWQRLGDGLPERYFVAAWKMVTWNEWPVLFIPEAHWPAVLEIGLAICKMRSDHKRPACWLLRLCNGVMVNGEWPSWPDVQAEIIRKGGPDFAISQLKQASRELRLTTPKEEQDRWHEARRNRQKNAP